MYALFLLQDAGGSVCQSKIFTAPLVSDIGLSEHASVSGLSGVSVITAGPCSSKMEQSQDWKRLETEDWKGWKEDDREPAVTALPGVSLSEPATTVTSAIDLRQVKLEQPLNYSTGGSPAATSEVRSGRVIASVAPCTPVQPNKQLSPPWKVPLPGAPPPLLHSASSLHDQLSASPLPTSVIQSPVGATETSPLSQNDSDDSEQELRHRSPSPEPRPINEECCRSQNAMYAICIVFV